MEPLHIGIIATYAALLSFILLYSFMQLSLVIHYIRSKYLKKSGEDFDGDFIPFITVQLPIYNEKYVIERLIDAVAKFDYPKDKFEVQVIDDSTDDTFDLVAAKITEVQKLGIDIKHVLRKNRQGYKAGALADSMDQVKGEFIAIFDADFVPTPDFLKKTIPHFRDRNVGVVQTKWEHLNEKYSMLTRLQAFGLDAHFSIEQAGRNHAKYFINFNGTAGVWRKTTIEDAGGWQSDTLTEDLDLSYRAQLKNWKFVYLESQGSPAELPANISALKTQQYRWTKGAAECAKKNLGKVVKAKDLKWRTKIHAVFHLMNSFLFVCIISTAVLSIPLLILKHEFPAYNEIIKYGGVFSISLIILSIFYGVSFVSGADRKWRAVFIFPFRFFMFLSVSMGLSLHNAVAVVEGYAGRKTPFVRTPKFNSSNKKAGWIGKQYITKSLNVMTMIEGLLACYFAFGIYLSFTYLDFGLLPYLIMLFIGFFSVYVYSIKHSFSN
ncbi:MAG: cellulose synthase/poly-beta-1,6-N-acetylglucosamine synthase-like glycosyltransferase [Flavobacteriales bacterium]|jgi:cellulose synthase/poly-beta-1,6-N-acetylglucosamine synthase-like glycosyltransferase